MKPDEAAWVREHVFTGRLADSHGDLSLCSCQWGMCGACAGDSDKGRPRHDRCVSRSHGRPVVYPVTWLTDRRGFVIGPPLWRAGSPPCRYICPCPCPKTGPIGGPSRRNDSPKAASKPTPAVPADDGALFSLEVS